MNRALLTDQKAGADLHADRAEGKGRKQLPPVRYAAGRNHRHVDRVNHLRHQRHGSQLSDMAAALGSLGDDHVRPLRDDPFGQTRPPE